MNNNDRQAGSPALDVLVVEDNAASQKLFAQALQSAGHRVQLAANGLEAIRSVLRRQPDVVVIDLQMPILDGIQTTPLLRALQSDNRPLSIIATTARLDPAEQSRFLAAGVDSFLAKPVTVETLQTLVAQSAVNSAAHEEEAMKTAPQETSGVPAAGRSVDLGAALDRLGGDRRLLDDLIGFFFEDAFPLLTQVHDCAARRDWPGAGRAAHSLKGLAANFSAAPAVAALQLLENYEEASVGDTTTLMRDVDREMARLAAALAEFAENNPS